MSYSAGAVATIALWKSAVLAGFPVSQLTRFAVCFESRCLAYWPCVSLNLLSTVSYIQVVIAYIQMFTRLGAWVPVSPGFVCRLTVSISGHSRLWSADEIQLLRRTQTVVFGFWAFSTSAPDAWNTLSSELRRSLVSLDCFIYSLMTLLYSL